MKRRLLLVEDEPGLVVTLTDCFRSAGYEVDVATTGPAALERALAGPYDLILLDIMLPGLSGLEVCRELRRGSVETPILMLTALGDVVDKVVGLRIGADDYLTKPFATVELLARVEALLRRSSGAPARPRLPDTLCFGDVEIRFPEVEVLRQGLPVQLSPRMFELLRFFVARRGKAVTRDESPRRRLGPGHRGLRAHRRRPRGLAPSADRAGEAEVSADGAGGWVQAGGLRGGARACPPWRWWCPNGSPRTPPWRGAGRDTC